jgi:DNA polymerase-1
MIIKFQQKPELLLIDGEYLLYRSYFAFNRPGNSLKTSTGKLSGAFYGFFSYLAKYLDRYGAENNIICWGSHRTDLKRLEILPTYKHDRKSMPMELRVQEQDIKSALSSIQFSQYTSTGYESDDVIAHFIYTTALLHPDRKAFIVTGDKDLRQLITKDVQVIAPTTGGDTVHNISKVTEDFGVGPELLADYLTLVGDTSDGIEGIPSIGEKTAAKLLQENGAIKDWFNDIFSIIATEKIKQVLQDHREQLIINKTVISLTKCVDIPVIRLSMADGENPTTVNTLFDLYEMKKIRPEQFFKYR